MLQLIGGVAFAFSQLRLKTLKHTPNHTNRESKREQERKHTVKTDSKDGQSALKTAE